MLRKTNENEGKFTLFTFVFFKVANPDHEVNKNGRFILPFPYKPQLYSRTQSSLCISSGIGMQMNSMKK
jgi:hypothetical protein